MKINILNESNDRFMLLSKLFAYYPDISSEDEDYLNNLSMDELVSEIRNRGWDNVLEESLNEYWDKVEDTPYYKVASKSVMDSDGFWTEYTMYYNEDEDNYFFIFGDSDIYGPDPAYADWECETNEEAVEWYNSYNGFEDEDDFDDFESFEIEEDDDEVDECLEEKLTIDEDLFDIVELPQADPIPDLPVVETDSEPSKETPDQGPEFGVADLLNNLISSNWNLNSSYNELIVNAEANSMNDIADVVKDISADINNHIGRLQAALATICPSVENIAVGEEEATQQLEPEVNEELSPSEKARLEKRGTVNRKTIDRLNKITSKYNGFHEPEEIRQMWDELSAEGVEVGLISGRGDRAEDGAKSWTVEWSLEGIPVWNSYFIYSFYEPENSTKNDYTIYFS